MKQEKEHNRTVNDNYKTITQNTLFYVQEPFFFYKNVEADIDMLWTDI